MADGFFAKGVKRMAQGEIVWKAVGGSNMRILLIDTLDDTPNLTTDDLLSDILAAAREEESGNMTLIDAADDGILDANDVTFTGTTGDACEGILMKKHVDGISDPLFLWWDAATGLPVTLGGDVSVVWPAGTNKIAKV